MLRLRSCGSRGKSGQLRKYLMRSRNILMQRHKPRNAGISRQKRMWKTEIQEELPLHSGKQETIRMPETNPWNCGIRLQSENRFQQGSGIRVPSERVDIIDIAVAYTHMVAVHADGTVSAIKIRENEDRICDETCDVETWRDVVAVACASSHTIGVTSDGRILATGSQRIGDYLSPLPDEIREWTANIRYLRTRVE